jgi:hypothetical protein
MFYTSGSRSRKRIPGRRTLARNHSFRFFNPKPRPGKTSRSCKQSGSASAPKTISSWHMTHIRNLGIVLSETEVEIQGAEVGIFSFGRELVKTSRYIASRRSITLLRFLRPGRLDLSLRFPLHSIFSRRVRRMRCRFGAYQGAHQDADPVSAMTRSSLAGNGHGGLMERSCRLRSAAGTARRCTSRNVR